MNAVEHMDATLPTVGDELPHFVRTTGLENWNRYAAVNDEFVSIHMDDEAGRAAGFDGAFGMGNLQWSYLHNVLRSWLGPEARIVSLECQFRSPNVKGATVTARGSVREVTRRDDTTVRVTVDVRTEDETGRVLAPGTAVVDIPA